ncbi:response regulator [Stenomitos frigidus]|uniref:Response regulator n=1 Tax=Stenomitos frigidus ULC18 TaxID=2107698 RepID=A0A2T1DUE5_9CYAN|nr:response regulator [Stenomitos frigidus]PSB24119.1 response regulator [Stenomitos frigidus ULC18]
MPPHTLGVLEVATKRILVVDDEASIREVVALCLQRLGGWDVLTAASGREALEQAQADQPDAIVLDVMMPEMDGFAFLQYLRSDPTTQPIPVVLLTANSYLPNPQLFPKLGIVLTILKPFQPIDLVQQIAQAMGW